jgi:hypothetical protein
MMARSRSISSGFEEKAAGVVTEDAEALAERGGVGFGKFEKVERGVETGAGVGVGAEAHAHALEQLDERARGVVFAAVERHVFEEVGDAALVVLLVKRAGADVEAEGGAALGLGVGADGVAEAVGQGAEAHGGIGSEIGRFVGERNRGGAGHTERQGGDGEEQGGE